MAIADLMKTLNLDASTIKNPLDLVNLSREGLPQYVIKTIEEYLSVNSKIMARLLGISPKTLERYNLDKNKKLNTAVSQRVLRLVLIKNECEDVFGGNDKACTEWFNTEVMALGGKTPLDLMDNDFGIDMVLTELGRIKYGIVS